MKGGNKSSFKPQNEFPLLEDYKKVFQIDKYTIFAWNDCIYCNYRLPDDIIIHEQTHLEQQSILGLDIWVKYYLENPEFRLNMEIDAYREQLKSIKDRNLRTKIRIESAKSLSSPLYGNIISYDDALKILK